MQGHRAVDDSIRDARFSISSMLFFPVGGILWEVQTLSPTDFPAVAPWVETSTSVTVPPLTSDSKSVLLSSSVSGNTTHNHGPSIFGPPFGNPGLLCQMSVIFSPKPSRGEKSEIWFAATLSHVKLVNLARGVTSDMSLSKTFSHVKLVNPASGDISEMSLS